MTQNKVLIVLGAPNTPKGELSEIAKSRLDCAARLYTDSSLILCTGGWGDHFNIAPQAHAVYAKKYLLKKGIPEIAFLTCALSSNTVEDAVMSRSILSILDNPLLTIITSDFHLERVQLIFDEVLSEFTIQYKVVNSDFLEADHRARLMKHERQAIQGIIKNGLHY